MTPTVLFVLQNAWRKGAKPGETEYLHEAVWERLLWRSQTGKRLKEILPDGIPCKVVDASSRVGNNSASVFPADRVLMAMRMERIKPDLVVLLGKVAETLAPVIHDYECPCIIGPHPAWRLL